jgi:glycosyltransferase involved in cell wall biosynthesis
MSPTIHVLFLNAHGGVGADTDVHLSLARWLDRRHVRVSAAVSAHEPAGASAREAFDRVPDVRVLALDLGRTLGQSGGGARVRAVLRNVTGMSSLIRLAGWCRTEGVDIVHVTERPRQIIYGLLLARLARCALLIHAHTSLSREEASGFGTLRLRQADAVVGVSHFTADTYKRLAQLPDERVFAVHNAVDSRIFSPERALAGRHAMRSELGLPADAVVIGCIARLMRWKGQDTLLDAFAALQDTFPTARLVLAGRSADGAPDGLDGDYRDYLERRIAALGLQDQVLLPGFLPQPRMPDFFGALDVVAHPATDEPFGLAVVEAMASGRPVVAGRGGGILEIIQDGVEGILVPPDNAASIADALRAVLGDDSRASALAEAGRARVIDCFTPERQAESMLGVYRKVVNRRRDAMGACGG